MKQETLLPRQRYAFTLCAMSAPAVTVASRLPWPWVLTVTLLAAALLVGQDFLLRVSQKNQGTSPLLPAVAVGEYLFAAVLLWHLALGTDSAFPQQDTLPFVPLSLLALTAWSVWQGPSAVARAAAVLFFLLLGLYAAVFFFAAGEMDFSRLSVQSQGADLLPLGVVLLVPFLGCCLRPEKERQEKFPTLFLLLFLFLPAAAAAVCAAVPGSGGSFYTMAGSLEVLSFAQRMEPLVSALMTVGWFCAMSLTALFCGERAAAWGLAPKYGAVASCLLGIVPIWLNFRIPPQFLLPLGAVFCVFSPLLTQGFVARKKVKNFLKNK